MKSAAVLLPNSEAMLMRTLCHFESKICNKKYFGIASFFSKKDSIFSVNSVEIDAIIADLAQYLISDITHYAILKR